MPHVPHRRAASRPLSACAALLLGAAAFPLAAQGADSAAAEAHHVAGRELMRANRFDSAAVEYAEAVRIRSALGDSAGLASSLNSLGSARYQVGEYEFALEAFLRSLELRRALHDSVGVARVLTNVGKSYQDFGQYDRAVRVLEEAVAVAEGVEAPGVLGYALNTLAFVKSDLGDQAAARPLIARSLALYASANPPQSISDSAGSGWLLNTLALGTVEMRDGRPDVAVRLFSDLVRVAVAARSPRGEALTRLHLGQAYRAAGDPRRATAEFERSLAVARGTRQRVHALQALRELAELEQARGNTTAALRDLRAYHALRDTVFDRSTAQRIAVLESRMEQERQQRENLRLLEERRAQQTLITRQRVVVALGGLVIALGAVVVVQLVRNGRRSRDREAELGRTNADLERLNGELRTALAEVRTLKGFIPICAHCKSVRDDRGFWEAVETYVGSRSEAMFSHSICPKCGPALYGEEWPSAEPRDDALEGDPPPALR